MPQYTDDPSTSHKYIPVVRITRRGKPALIHLLYRAGSIYSSYPVNTAAFPYCSFLSGGPFLAVHIGAAGSNFTFLYNNSEYTLTHIYCYFQYGDIFLRQPRSYLNNPITAHMSAGRKGISFY